MSAAQHATLNVCHWKLTTHG